MWFIFTKMRIFRKKTKSAFNEERSFISPSVLHSEGMKARGATQPL